MRSPRLYFVLLLLFAFAGCQDTPTPLAPDAPPTDVVRTESASPLGAISDAVNDGNAHFFWLPPMVDHPGAFNGPFDGTLQAVVTICELSDCAGTTIEQFSVSGGSVTVEDEIYKAEWDTDASSATTGTTYRMIVSVAGTEIGYADVMLAATGSEAKNLTTGETIGLKDGRTLPIKFRLEEGAAFVVDPSAGGAIEALAGQVKVAVPPGALTTETAITVQKTTTTGSALTAVTFGPAGTTFSAPVPVTLGYDPSVLPPGVAESDLALNLLDDQGRWIVLPGSVVDEVTDEVTAPFHHFSTGGAGPAELAIFCPGDGAPETFEVLSDAVDAVMVGGTIEVCDGTHVVQNVHVDKGMTIEGASGVRPTITNANARWSLIVGDSGAYDTLTSPFTIRNLRLRTDYSPSSGFASVLFLGDLVQEGLVDDVDLEVLTNGSGIVANDGQIAGSSIVIQGVSATGGRNGVLVFHDGTGSVVEVKNSSFDGFFNNGIVVAGITPVDSRTRIDNITVTGGGNGVLGYSAAPLVDVLNSSFTDNLVWLRNGSSGLIQNNTFNGCDPSACIQVAGGGQLEPTRIIGNQMTSLNGNTDRAIWLNELDAGPFEVRDNVIDGTTNGGDRSDPASYTFGEGILFQRLEASGTVTGNTISGTFVTFAAEGGTASASVNDNTASQSWSPVSVHNGAQMTAHSNDFTDYQAAIDANEPFGTGDLTCNWWGAATGPTGLFPSIAEDVYTPWATTPVAGTSTTSCSGGP